MSRPASKQRNLPAFMICWKVYSVWAGTRTPQETSLVRLVWVSFFHRLSLVDWLWLVRVPVIGGVVCVCVCVCFFIVCIWILLFNKCTCQISPLFFTVRARIVCTVYTVRVCTVCTVYTVRPCTGWTVNDNIILYAWLYSIHGKYPFVLVESLCGPVWSKSET